MSTKGISPEDWGPKLWESIHSMAAAYPDVPQAEHKASAANFLESLKFLLPCTACQQHLRQHLQRYPYQSVLHCGESFFRWTVDLHNAVNASLGKPAMSYEDAKAKYDVAGRACGSNVYAMPPVLLAEQTASESHHKRAWKPWAVAAAVSGGLAGLAAIYVGVHKRKYRLQ